MSDVVQRLRLPGLMSGIVGFIPAESMPALLAPAFECQGFDYFIRPMRFSEWQVFKCDGRGRELAEYRVTRTGQGLACDCPSGRRHLECRHKEMVRMAADGPGTRATDARDTRVTRPAAAKVQQPKADLGASRALLERARGMIEGWKKEGNGNDKL